MAITKKPEFSMKNGKDKTVKKFANDEEKKIAKLIDGRRSPNSGATRFLKGDIYSGDCLVELKSAMSAKQIIVSEKILRKVEREAALEGKCPVVVLNFPQSKVLNNKAWMVVPI